MLRIFGRNPYKVKSELWVEESVLVAVALMSLLDLVGEKK